MRVDPDEVAAALTETTDRLAEAASFGWARRRPGAVAFVSTAPAWFANGVVVDRCDVNAGAVGALLDEVAASGFPHGLRLRPCAGAELDALARARGMRRGPDEPLFVRGDLGDLPEDPGDARMSIRQIIPEDAECFAVLCAAGFGAPIEVFRILGHPSVLRARGLRSYIGSVDGEPVAISAGHRVGSGLFMLNVATLTGHRGRGLANAMTLRALRDGADDGGRWAFLFSSPMAVSLYARLGFEPFETWRCWTSAEAP